MVSEFESKVLAGFDEAARNTFGKKFPQVLSGVEDCDLGRVLPVIRNQVCRLAERYGYEFGEEEE